MRYRLRKENGRLLLAGRRVGGWLAEYARGIPDGSTVVAAVSRPPAKYCAVYVYAPGTDARAWWQGPAGVLHRPENKGR